MPLARQRLAATPNRYRVRKLLKGKAVKAAGWQSGRWLGRGWRLPLNATGCANY
ncbi:hypothetical protein [Erwinia sp.]|uniref:hypothetical protein n=1 Tax=Erwinia citreus TaxID=558 RepID=UPI00289BAFD0|nr:hypothetical protein [Erwinia sp.]